LLMCPGRKPRVLNLGKGFDWLEATLTFSVMERLRYFSLSPFRKNWNDLLFPGMLPPWNNRPYLRVRRGMGIRHAAVCF
ncbi:MAG: hypothetical protein WB502_11775, partial [Thermoactinomyces sp.]